jgi:hypothetical protein
MTARKRRSKVGGARPGAGRPRLPAGEKRSGRVLLAFTAEELAALREAAGSEPVATVARRLVVRALQRRDKK